MPRRDPEASKPYTADELRRILEATERDDSEWIHPATLFLSYSGAHISVLSGGWREETVNPPDGSAPYVELVYSDPLTSDAVRGDWMYWPRPKTETAIRMPVSENLRGWVGPWLDDPRPHSRARYNQVYDRIGRATDLQVNPLRFRHTCAVYLHHVKGFSIYTVARLLGVSLATLRTYVEETDEMILQKVRISHF